jgi:hypothetical protein
VRARGRLRRFGAAVASTAVAAAGLVAFAAPSASAATQEITNATFEWGINPELQSAPPFGGCNFLSAGASDGSEEQYRVTDGTVSIVKNGTAPTWANKCDGAATGTMNQKVVWSGGTGTIDPSTGAATISFPGKLSLNFYGGLTPFFIENPVLTVDASGDGSLVATLGGFASDQANPFVKTPIESVSGVTVVDLSNVAGDNTTGFTVTPDYAGVLYDAPAGGGAQNRSTTGWGSWPDSFVDFHFVTGLSSYWYSSGGVADVKKPPTVLTVAYGPLDGGEDPGTPPPAGTGQQVITAQVPEEVDPGEFVWTIDAEDRTVTLTEAQDKGTYLHSTGAIKPIKVTDGRLGGPTWSISGQVGDFTGGIDGKHLGWKPFVSVAGSGAVPGGEVLSGFVSGNGLKSASLLASAPSGHAVGGTATLGADLDLRIPQDTAPGTYSATLTITALS